MPTILAIDDSPTLRKFISKHLGERFPGATVLLAGNGAEGVATAKRDKPDVILLDYLLPDCKGEEVCEQLEADEATRSIPVILMSSSTPDITRTEGMFTCIKRSMAKPFSPELLCASVNFVLTLPAAGPETPAEGAAGTEDASASDSGAAVAPASVIAPKLEKLSLSKSKPVTRPLGVGTPGTVEMPEFCGALEDFPLLRVLQAPVREKLTGVLKLEALPLRAEVYYRDGQPVLATTRDPGLYLKDAPIKVPEDQVEAFEAVKKEQAASGEPVFSLMKAREWVPAETADAMMREYSALLLAHFWTAAGGRFLFQRLKTLPAFAEACGPLEDSIEQFALASLRSAVPAAPSTGTAGTPAYNPNGYTRIQGLLLEPEEAAFAEQVGAGGQSLADIAATLGVEPAAAEALLFRFQALDIFDYWPPAA